MRYLLTKKIGMTTIFDDGRTENVTLLEVGKNVVVGKRTKEKDGYNALRVAFDEKVIQKKQRNNNNKKEYEKIREWRLISSDEIDQIQVGEKLDLINFKKGDKVFVRGVSKGKGFQGVVKRHGFRGSPASHGHRHDLRAPGSIGSAFPERVMKGKKMAGRMGGKSVTIKNLTVVLVDKEKKLLAVRGSIPGSRGSLVVVTKQ